MTSPAELDALADAAAAAVVQYRAVQADAELLLERARVARLDTVAALHDAGWSVRRIAAELDVSSSRVGQLLESARARRAGEWAEDLALRPMRSTALEEYRLARHAQELREEAFTGGNVTERDAFYGRKGAAAMDGAERAITLRGWLEGSAVPV